MEKIYNFLNRKSLREETIWNSRLEHNIKMDERVRGDGKNIRFLNRKSLREETIWSSKLEKGIKMGPTELLGEPVDWIKLA
jgi:hypothetical protein